LFKIENLLLPRKKYLSKAIKVGKIEQMDNAQNFIFLNNINIMRFAGHV